MAKNIQATVRIYGEAGLDPYQQTCNGCDAAPADPSSPAGYCTECETAARGQAMHNHLGSDGVAYIASCAACRADRAAR